MPSAELQDDFDAELAAVRFGLERHLQNVLRDNWGQHAAGAKWALCADDELCYAVSEIPSVEV